MPMYPEEFVIPMRKELTSLGFQELRTAQDVDKSLKDAAGTVLVMVNSICGCAAGKARPAVAQALQNLVKPDRLTTVFAGQDAEATAQARSYFTGMPPSSPAIAILKDGKLAYIMHRRDIESRNAPMIAAELVQAFEQHCR